MAPKNRKMLNKTILIVFALGFVDVIDDIFLALDFAQMKQHIWYIEVDIENHFVITSRAGQYHGLFFRPCGSIYGRQSVAVVI